MDLTSISQQISEWVDKGRILVFASSFQDEWLYRQFINHILYNIPKDRLLINKYRSDLSHIEPGSIMVDDLSEIECEYSSHNPSLKSNVSRYQIHKMMIEKLREKIIEERASQIIYTTLYTNIVNGMSSSLGGSSLMYMSDMFGIICDGHFSIQKLRFDNSDDYKDVDLTPLFRDKKIDQILSIK